MTPFVSDPDFTLYVGDALEVLQAMPAESVHCCVTSPPYWGLRDYGTEGQLGLEPTPDEYVANMVNVFRAVRRVLRADGTLWLNIGDSYAPVNYGANAKLRQESPNSDQTMQGKANHWAADIGGSRSQQMSKGAAANGIKQKDLCGIPWRLAFALQADGWYLRSDIIWAKPNPMPESVTDRPTKAHEYLFLLTKSPRYYFDQDAIREDYTPDDRRVTTVQSGNGAIGLKGVSERERWAHSGRNKRSVWEIATEAYPDAHFATFPQALVEPCVKAGTSEHGCCPVCGAPWEREVERVIPTDPGVINGKLKGNVPHHRGGSGRRLGQAYTDQLNANPPRTTGWKPACACSGGADGAGLTEAGANSPGLPATGEKPPSSVSSFADCVPCVVLDPFLGSGTTAQVARRLGRRSIGIELNPEYAQLAARRLQQLSLFAVETAEA